MATQALHDKVHEDVVTIIVNLALDGLRGAHKQRTLDTDDHLFPAAFCTLDGCQEGEDPEADGFEEYGVTLPVRVLLIDRQPARQHKLHDQVAYWRESIRNAFRRLPIWSTAGSAVWDVEVREDPVFDPRLPAYLLLVSSLMVVARCTVSRNKA